jgi:hypothetical protein
VCTYACKEGLGGFLTQNGHVICYESKKLKGHKGIILPVTWRLKLFFMCRNYLMGGIFELRIDHSGMIFFFEEPTLNSIQTRWLEFLIKYDFEVKHIKGKESEVVDEISRRLTPKLCAC